MENKFDDLLQKVSSFLRDEAKTETVVGEPFHLGSFECVPVIRLGMGFGSGSGTGLDEKHRQGEGMGAGGGIGIEPIGFLVSKGEEISFISTKSSRGLASTFEKLPELMEKFLASRKEKTVAEV